MPVFDNTTILRFAQEGEIAFSIEYPCILKRVSLATVSGTALVALPDDVKSIRRVTWKSHKLDPLPSRNFREVFQSASQQGRPFWYVFNNVGQNQLQLFPAPNETLAAVTVGLFGSAIPDRLIVEYFCASDVTTYLIPSFFRRRLLKSYVLRGCFNIEGQGQNSKNSKYFKDRWNMLSKLYGQLLADLVSKPRKLTNQGGLPVGSDFPGFPVLPIDKFGISVDKGE